MSIPLSVKKAFSNNVIDCCLFTFSVRAASSFFRILFSIVPRTKGYREQQIDISYDLVGILPASLLNDLQNGETA